MKTTAFRYLSLAVIVLLAVFARTSLASDLFFSAIREVPVAAAAGSREPSLAVTADGQVYLSWLEPVDGARFALRFARFTGNGWSAPASIAEGSNWFINWADFPALSAVGDSGLAASWLVETGSGPYAYELRLALSGDGGRSWSDPLVPHDDATPTQHGLASMLPWPDGRLLVTWLDGRINARGALSRDQELPTDEMTLRAAIVDLQGRVSERTLLDERVCTCCPTAAVMTDDGALIAYRDRSPDEVRDFAVSRYRSGRWSAPRVLHSDGWQIAGCPINGAALAAQGRRVAAAWFTAAGDQPRVKLAFSSDSGEHFSAPVDVDDGRPLGRIDLVLLADGSALVSWLEVTRGEELRFRRVSVDGQRETSRVLFRSGRGRSSGFPRMARRDGEVFFAWTRTGDPLSISTAVMTLSPNRLTK